MNPLFLHTRVRRCHAKRIVTGAVTLALSATCAVVLLLPDVIASVGPMYATLPCLT